MRLIDANGDFKPRPMRNAEYSLHFFDGSIMLCDRFGRFLCDFYLDNVPTAYDLDNVVNQLKENSFVPDDRIGVSDVKIIMSEKSIEIVKSGGVGNGD